MYGSIELKFFLVVSIMELLLKHKRNQELGLLMQQEQELGLLVQLE
jgi:hypothetical protein